MKKLGTIAAAIVIVAGCSLHHDKNASKNPYDTPPFYTQWTTSNSGIDVQIRNAVASLRNDPNNAAVHNQLGQLLVAKGFPKDAETEFERAADADGNYYQAWYNLGLIRQGHGDYTGAERAFRHTIKLAKGHSEALFQMGLIEETRGNDAAAIDYFAKAIRHNPQIVDVRTNPRVLDTKLIQLALLKNYERDHARQASQFLSAPNRTASAAPPPQTQPAEQALTPQATPAQIVTPTAPVTEPGRQVTPPAMTPTPPPTPAPPRTTT